MAGEMERSWRRLKKKHGYENREPAVRELKERMEHLVGGPGDMAAELADWFIGESPEDEDICRADEALDLFCGNWSPAESLLNEEDWEFIRDLVNIYAGGMDMNDVTYIMRIVVDNGGFRNQP